MHKISRTGRASHSPARRAASLVATLAVATGLMASPAPAQAQSSMPAPAVSSQSSGSFIQEIERTLQAASMQVNSNARNAVWDARNGLRFHATNLAGPNKDYERQLHSEIDRIVEQVAPGLIAEKTPRPPAPKPAPKPAPQPASRPAAPAPEGCAKTARVCVDLTNQRTWLQQGGKPSYGPVRMASGKPGYETPRGFFYVNRKVRDEISYEFGNAPMPFAVYFTYNGIAFHQGDPSIKSHGCIRMYRNDAEQYFNSLRIGDQVHVF